MSGRGRTDRPFVVAREVGNWLNLSTPVGLTVALAGRARLRRGKRGLWLAEGYRYRFPAGGAFTIGNVVTTASPSFADLAREIPGILEHEENHTWQYAYACGLPYLPVYTALMAWSWLRTGDRASGNFFEREAGLDAGGYRESPRRSLTDGLRALLALAGRPTPTPRQPRATGVPAAMGPQDRSRAALRSRWRLSRSRRSRFTSSGS